MSPKVFLFVFICIIFALDYGIFIPDDRFLEFNTKWVFQDLLLHEMELFLLDCWTLQVSFAEIIETCQKSSTWCVRASPQSCALSCLWNAPWGKKSPWPSEAPWLFARLYSTRFLSLDNNIFSSNDRFGEFNGQRSIEDLLLDEMKASSFAFECSKCMICGDHSKLVRNLSTVSRLSHALTRTSLHLVSPHFCLDGFT